MSVDKTPTGVVYTVTNGAVGQQYPLTFPYINGADVKAYYVQAGVQTSLLYGTHYTVVGQNFIASIVLPVGAKLAIYRQTDLTQEILWKDGQAVYTPDIMKADDKLTLIAQEISADMSRTVKLTREEAAAGGNPEDVVQSIYASRDAAAASADAASAQATAAENSATAAASSANTAAQTVETAAADAVNAATAQAAAAALSAAAAARSAEDAAAASGGMAPRMDAAEQINAQQDSRLTAVESRNTQQDTRLDSAESALSGKANVDLSNATGNAIGLYLYARDEKASGTHGGTSAAAAWQTRDLNTLKMNNLGGASLSGNRVTLPAGRYYVRGKAPAYATSMARCAIYDVTNAAYLLHGNSMASNSAYYGYVTPEVEGEFTLAAQATIELRMYTFSYVSSYGLGYAVGVANINEVFSELRIWKM